MEDVSESLLFNIFGRMTLKSLGGCVLVCRRWASIIRSKDFAKIIQGRGSNQPRLLAGLWDTSRFFYPNFSYSYGTHRSFESRYSGTGPVIYDCVNGLISHGTLIVNPSLNLEIDVPSIYSEEDHDWEEKRLLGFDLMRVEYKIFALKRRDITSGCGGYNVITVGEDSSKWRMVHSSTPRWPKTNSVCIEGMIYYLALTHGKCHLVRFNVSTEVVDSFEVPDESSSSLASHLDKENTLLNYQGKLGFVCETLSSQFALWLLDDTVTQTWSMTTFSLPGDLHYMRSIGAVGVHQETGEIVMVASGKWPRQLFMVSINIQTHVTTPGWWAYYDSLSDRGFMIREFRNTTTFI